MPIDAHHRPDFFPRHFHTALAFRGEGYGFEIARGTQPECLREARRFRAFVGSCREYPLSAGAKHLAQITPRTQIKELPSGEHICLVVVKENIDLAGAIKNAIGAK